MLVEALNSYNPLPTCASTHSLGVDDFGLGFVACASDCYAASITDALLALHCAFWARRVWRTSSGSGAMRIAVLGTLISNSAWSAFGALVWLQPGGNRDAPFDTLFRLNGLSQACLVFSWWCVISEALRGMATVPPIVPRLIKPLAAAHACCFALRNLECQIEDYVLCGGAHVTPPLGSLWLLFVLLCRRHSLLSAWLASPARSSPHPLLMGALCGFIFWFGNSAILFGAKTGLTYWSHYSVQALCRLTGILPAGGLLHQGAFEEMACFHFYGMLGNDMLFRAYTWLAQTEDTALQENSLRAAGGDAMWPSPPVPGTAAALALASPGGKPGASKAAGGTASTSTGSWGRNGKVALGGKSEKNDQASSREGSSSDGEAAGDEAAEPRASWTLGAVQRVAQPRGSEHVDANANCNAARLNGRSAGANGDGNATASANGLTGGGSSSGKADTYGHGNALGLNGQVVIGGPAPRTLFAAVSDRLWVYLPAMPTMLAVGPHPAGPWLTRTLHASARAGRAKAE